MPKVSILTCALVMHSVGLWLQGIGCIEERLFHMREINAILGSCKIQMALVLLRSPSGGLRVLLFGLDSSGFGRSCLLSRMGFPIRLKRRKVEIGQEKTM